MIQTFLFMKLDKGKVWWNIVWKFKKCCKGVEGGDKGKKPDCTYFGKRSREFISSVSNDWQQIIHSNMTCLGTTNNNMYCSFLVAMSGSASRDGNVACSQITLGNLINFIKQHSRNLNQDDNKSLTSKTLVPISIDIQPGMSMSSQQTGMTRLRCSQ